MNFTALQQRLGAGPRTLPRLVVVTPASYAAFNVPAVAGLGARDLPLGNRAALLEKLPNGWERPLSLFPATTGRDMAEQWLQDMPHISIEGLVIKRTSQP